MAQHILGRSEGESHLKNSLAKEGRRKKSSHSILGNVIQCERIGSFEQL